MQAKLANILKEQFKPLDFINKLGGLVFTQTQVINNDNIDNNRLEKYVKKYPCSTDVWLRHSNKDITGDIIDFVPDSSNVGMVYFEPTSDIRESETRGKRTRYTCGFRIVFWGNSNKISHNENLTDKLQRQMQIQLKKLKGKNKEGFICIMPTITGISATNSIFNPYTYDEEVTQYLMPPFVYFAINIDVSFYSNNNCCVNFNPKISECQIY